MFRIKNDVKRTNIMCTGSHKSFPTHSILRGKFLKRILTYLYSIKDNEINICHLDVKDTLPVKNCINSINILYTGSYKIISIYCGQ